MGVLSLIWEDPLEKEMATHSSLLAGKSHGQRNPACCSPWGHKIVGHDLVTEQQQTVTTYLSECLVGLYLLKGWPGLGLE